MFLFSFQVQEQRLEAKKELAEKQRSEVERLKADEVLTLKECVNIDHLVTARRPETIGAPAVTPAAAPVTGSAAPGKGAGGPGAGGDASLPVSYQMAAPMNEAEMTALVS